MPLRAHESILIFAPKLHASYYRPQKVRSNRPPSNRHVRTQPTRSTLYRGHGRTTIYINDGCRHPRSVLRFDSVSSAGRMHPTQKPLDLVRWLIRSYTRPGALVCDPFAGSGTTAEACVIEGRRFFGCERDRVFFSRAQRRVRERMQSAAAARRPDESSRRHSRQCR
jgi:site-specific DNA-methyltransferase (adenine-specific)